MKIMGFGTFDGVHPGHRFFLGELKKMGDELIIVIARDKNVKKVKRKEPKYNEKERLRKIEETGIPTKVVPGNEEDFYEIIHQHKPDVIGLGYDQRADEKKIKELFPDIEIKRMSAFEPEKYKSSLINGTKD